MKTIWNIVCIVALANLLAIGGLAGWLVSSGRLDGKRLNEVRKMLAETIAVQEAREEAEAKEAEMQASADAAVEDRGMALSAAELLSVRMEMSEIDHEQAQMLQRQTQDLRQGLLREIESFRRDRAQFLSEKEAFERETARIAEIDGGQQFRKAVKTLEGLKPGDASTLLMALIDGGPAKGSALDASAAAGTPQSAQDVREDGMIRAVAYMNALQDRTRVKIIEEIAKQQPRLAAELLERIRTRGMLDRAPESSAP